jgi:hypothetical protein
MFDSCTYSLGSDARIMAWLSLFGLILGFRAVNLHVRLVNLHVLILIDVRV